jgi:hypothetical protein
MPIEGVMLNLFRRILTKIKFKTGFPNTSDYPKSLVLDFLVSFMMIPFLIWNLLFGVTFDAQGNSLDTHGLWIALIGLPIALRLIKMDSLALKFCANAIALLILVFFDLFSAQIEAYLTTHAPLIGFVVLAFFSVVGALKLLEKPGRWLFDRYIATWCKDWENQGFIVGKSAFTELDKRSISIHEAGHAVILGLDPLIDNNCEVFLAIGPGRGSFGYCRGVAWPHQVHLRSYVLMDMVSKLAGVEAEKLVIGECGISGSADYAAWLDLAERMLLSDPDQVYFAKPISVTQIEHNRQTLNALRKEHQALARRILEANRGVLESLAALIREKHTVAGVELREILSAVKPVAGVPDFTHYTANR